MPGLGVRSGTAFQIGLLVNRPVAEPSIEGYHYFATDVNGGTQYACDGSSWIQLSSGLRNLAAGTNVSLSSTSSTITINATAAPYVLPIASASVLGGIKVGPSLSIDVGGTLSLPIASSSSLGGIKVGTGLSIDGSGVLSTTITSPLTTKGDLWGYSTVNARVPVGANGEVLTADSTQDLGVKWAAAVAGASTGAIEFYIFGEAVTIPTGVAGEVIIPFACTITGVTMLADRTTNAVVDIWKSSYSSYPPTVADSITASDKPTLTAASKMQNSTLTGWTTAISAGDILRFNTDSCSAAQRLLVSLNVTA